MSTSQYSQLSVVSGTGRREELEPSDGRYHPNPDTARIVDTPSYVVQPPTFLRFTARKIRNV